MTQKLPQIYNANHATFPIRIRKMTVQIFDNFWVTQYTDNMIISVNTLHLDLLLWCWLPRATLPFAMQTNGKQQQQQQWHTWKNVSKIFFLIFIRFYVDAREYEGGECFPHTRTMFFLSKITFSKSHSLSGIETRQCRLVFIIIHFFCTLFKGVFIIITK